MLAVWTDEAKAARTAEQTVDSKASDWVATLAPQKVDQRAGCSVGALAGRSAELSAV